MANENKSADAFETALKREMQRTAPVDSANCIAPEVVAAYHDRTLSRDESARVEAHLLSCARCQSMMAAMVRADDSERLSPRPEPPRGFWWIIRVATPIAAIGAVIAFAVGLRHRASPPPEVIALASPAVQMNPESAEPAPPPAARPETAATMAPPPESVAARAIRLRHHQVASRQAGGAREKTAPPESAFKEFAKAEPPSSFGGSSTNAPAAAMQPPPIRAKAASIARDEVAAAPSANSVTAPSASAPQSAAPSGGVALMERAEVANPGAAVSGTTGALARAAVLRKITSSDGSITWLFGDHGTIIRSGKSTRLNMSSGVMADLLAGSAPSNDVCWIVGRSGTILRTLDSGAHWQIVRAPSRNDFSLVTATDSNNATVSTIMDETYVTHDGGVTWSSN